MEDRLIIAYDYYPFDVPTLAIARSNKDDTTILNILRGDEAIGAYCYLIGKSNFAERYGKWILHKDGSGTCDQCNRTAKNVWDYDNYQNYCGHCGAKMGI